MTRIKRLRDLLVEVLSYEPSDLVLEEKLMADVHVALREQGPGSALARELRALLRKAIEDREYGPEEARAFHYATSRAIAEADGVVKPGGAIVFQHRWQDKLGNWSDWTEVPSEAPIKYPKSARVIETRVVAA